jgi:hypothetical protein
LLGLCEYKSSPNMLLSSTHVHTRANSGANNVVPDSGANTLSNNTGTNSFSNTGTNANADASARGANNNHNHNFRFRSDVVYDNVASFIAGSTDHEHTVDVDHSVLGATVRVCDFADNDDTNKRDSGEYIECSRKQCVDASVVKRFRRIVD